MAPPRPPRGPTALPPYEPPAHPLTPAAQRTLQALPQTHPLTRLKRHLDGASTNLTELAGEVNDRYWQRADYVRRRKARRAGQGQGDEGAEEERELELERMRGKVEGLTAKMEESVRRVLDAKARVEGTESALVEVAANVVAGNGMAAAGGVGGTQSTLGASQFRQGRKGRGGRRSCVVDEGEEEEGSEFEEEPSTQGENGQENVGPSQLLRKKMEEHKVRYDGLPLRTRYATNNTYIGFKRIVHDALHPGDDAPPLPNPSTWFPTDAALLPSTNTRSRARADGDEDDDDDLAIASERISIKCPLTLLPYKDPVTSSKCPHSFEKAAILDMIARSADRIGGEKAVKCPVCEMMLTPSTLHPDPILLRKVSRIRAAEARAADETTYSSDHDGDGRAARPEEGEEIVDDGDNGDGRGTGSARARSLAPRVKAERMGSLAPGTAMQGGGGGVGESERGGGRPEPGTGTGELVGTHTVTAQGAVVVDLGEGDGEEGFTDEDEGLEEEESYMDEV